MKYRSINVRGAAAVLKMATRMRTDARTIHPALGIAVSTAVTHSNSPTRSPYGKDATASPRWRTGESNGRHVLTFPQVREIRRRYAKGNDSHRDLSRLFGCSKSNVGSILTFQTWIE